MQRNLMAILRGVQPAEVVAIGNGLVAAGITQIEVPLNSPNACDSIALLVQQLGGKASVGAGTVTSVAEVQAVCQAGGQFVVSPNCDVDVIAVTKDMGMASYPGVMTPTECFAALNAGADVLKLFPAFMLGVAGFKAINAVLPKGTQCYAVGGIDGIDFAGWLQAGIAGFGLASNLYQPGASAEQVVARAELLVQAWDNNL
ncbi:MAG: 2-dehydro-3-deoxy-6-phosphogalactonate aldolase [Gammaproteobacteria bacterium]|jgi:2-dehydro-3-deoxyphosphogalactonate aldolase|nr:2-dehydro-3-deoxy-6-phosphogalactonate aldolase [Gammaproteobacteria bacterium]